MPEQLKNRITSITITALSPARKIATKTDRYTLLWILYRIVAIETPEIGKSIYIEVQ